MINYHREIAKIILMLIKRNSSEMTLNDWKKYKMIIKLVVIIIRNS